MKAHNQLIFTLLLSFSLTNALALVTVKGRLASATDDTPLAGATLRLLQLPDSTLLIGTYSDKDGNFSISSSKVSTSNNIRNPVKVLLVASYMGYQTTQKVVSLRHRVKEYDLKDVYMQEDARILGEALVSGTPPPVMVKEDTIEYFADSYKTQPDATAEDLLKRLPGVEVATDGSITAQGESVQQVYVDGKEFFGNNTQATTKNLTADMIESVQVVDMKTEEARLTGIDDGERRKVINLKLKPKMRRGWFGNAAAAWGQGHDISDRWDARGMAGYFRGHSQNALVVNANNTNNTAFGDLGDGMFGGSSMRGNRNSGRRGDGLNTSWSVGLNIGYDEGNRMRDPNTPLGIAGNVQYGGSNQDEESKTHRKRYDKNTETDSYSSGHNESQNVQFGVRYEKSWGEVATGRHRIQISPSFGYNETQTEDYDESHNFRSDSLSSVDAHHYISQTQRRYEMNQKGYNASISGTYSYMKRNNLGVRRSSITLSVSENMNDGEAYTRSYTNYGNDYMDFNRLADVTSITSAYRDTLINQRSTEDSHNENYRLRLTHVEPVGEKQTVELSASANLSDRRHEQIYHFWDKTEQVWSDSVNGRSNDDYNNDSWTRNVNYTLSASYRITSDTYNFNVGMDFLPQSQEHVEYNDHSRDYKRHYMNYAPRLEYRYNWTRRTNLRITLNGRTSQPSQNQLQARKNQTSATRVALGNPDLDPSFSTNFSARFRSFNDETYASIEAGLSARASFNNFVTKQWYSDDSLQIDTTMTVNLPGVGNWNVQGNFRGSWPFYDNIWYVTSNTSLGYSETDGYVSLSTTTINESTGKAMTIKLPSQLNTTRTYNGSQQAGIAYRTEKLNVELRGNYNVQFSEATVSTSSNLGTTHRFGVSANVLARLPWDFTLSSDYNYTARRGYSAGLTRNQSIWNAQLSRSFLQKKNLSAFVKVFDILHEKSSISRSVSATSIVDRETTVLGQYFLVGLSMRFNRMGGNNRQRGGNFNGGGSGNNRQRGGGGFPIGGGERINEFDM
ncbi:MAG: outer membrane beta-barrel protein [Bacteroidales bacterium]|nr:outer membrane beta-barrel protein [Bacteroidales bacterium]